MKALVASFIQRYIVLIMIVLIFSALVIIAILKDRILQFIGVLNPYAEQKALESMCRDRCSSWCKEHIMQQGTRWEDLTVKMPRGDIGCDEVMVEILGDFIGNCSCAIK